MKKIFTCCVVLLFTALKTFGLGTGFCFDFMPGFNEKGFSETLSGAAFTMKLDTAPVQLTAFNNWDFSNDEFNFSVQTEYFPLEISLSDFVSFSAGIESTTGISFNKESLSLNEAPGFSGELSITDFDGFLEYFFKISVQDDFKFGFNRKYENHLEIPFTAGILFWY